VAGVEVELATRMLQDLDVHESDLLSKLLHVHGFVAHVYPPVASVSKDNPCPDGRGRVTTLSRDEADAGATFRERYGRPASDATRELERLVIGGDFGANGYTTVEQAELLAQRLDLRAGDRLLDVGSGRGWPGLYLAKVTGSSVVLTDIPEEGLATARRRAAVEGVAERSQAVVSSARRLPFKIESFEAVVHTDVLC